MKQFKVKKSLPFSLIYPKNRSKRKAFICFSYPACGIWNRQKYILQRILLFNLQRKGNGNDAL